MMQRFELDLSVWDQSCHKKRVENKQQTTRRTFSPILYEFRSGGKMAWIGSFQMLTIPYTIDIRLQ